MKIIKYTKFKGGKLLPKCITKLMGKTRDLFKNIRDTKGTSHANHLYTFESEVPQSCPILCDPIDCSLPGSSVHGIFQARVLPILKNMRAVFLPWTEGWVTTAIQELILTYRSICLDRKVKF